MEVEIYKKQEAKRLFFFFGNNFLIDEEMEGNCNDQVKRHKAIPSQEVSQNTHEHNGMTWKTAPPAKELHSTVSNFHHVFPTSSFQKICNPMVLAPFPGTTAQVLFGPYYPEAIYNILFEAFMKE